MKIKASTGAAQSSERGGLIKRGTLSGQHSTKTSLKSSYLLGPKIRVPATEGTITFTYNAFAESAKEKIVRGNKLTRGSRSD